MASSMRSRMRPDSSSRRPLTTMRTPRRCISSISRCMVSWKSLIRARTSALGRVQFSVENAYTDSAWTPSCSQPSSTRLMARTPARWPKLAGRLRPRAQRPLPSMMIPIWRGTWSPSVRKEYRLGPKPAGSGSLELHDLVFLPGAQGVDLLDLRLGDLLEPGVGALGLVLGDLALLGHLVDPVELVATHVADRHASFLGLLADQLDVLLAA